MSFQFSFSGEQSRDPSEACSNYYFSEKESPILTLVQAGGHNRKPCPFSGVYSVSGDLTAISELVMADSRSLESVSRCQPGSDVRMHAGCTSHSSDIRIRQSCDTPDGGNHRTTPRDLVKIDLTNDLVCHGSWQHSDNLLEEGSRNMFDTGTATMTSAAMMIDDKFIESGAAQRRRQTRQQRQRNDVLVLSVKPRAIGEREKFLCLTYTAMPNGVLSAYVGPEACNYTMPSDRDTKENSAPYYSARRMQQQQRRRQQSLPYLSDSVSMSLSSVSSQDGTPHHQGASSYVLPFENTFNISPSGPCLQALKGSSAQSLPSPMALLSSVAAILTIYWSH